MPIYENEATKSTNTPIANILPRQITAPSAMECRHREQGAGTADPRRFVIGDVKP